MDKKTKKELARKYKQDQKSIFADSLPFDKALFVCLFDSLDETLEKGGCDNTLKYTLRSLEDNNLPVQESIMWFNQHGAGCDCEVLANIEDRITELSWSCT